MQIVFKCILYYFFGINNDFLPGDYLIQINNLKQHNEPFFAQYEAKFQSFLRNGYYILGEEVKSFETAFSKYIGTQHCISVANGTDAIELAIKALRLQTGAEIITAANAAMYSTISILNSGFKPKFVDLSLDGYNLDIEKVLAAITATTKAVIFTHLYGRGTDLTYLKNELSKKGVFLIEDCAQAHGCRIGNKKMGSFGDIATFSFYPTKNLGALGDGGAITTNDSILFQNVIELRQYGWGKKYHLKDMVGRNSRLDELQAAFLNTKLPHLDTFNARRVEIAETYLNGITNSKLQIRKWNSDGSYVAHLFPVEVKDSAQRASFAAYLGENKIGCDIHYPVPDYKQAPIKNLFESTRLEITEERCNKVLTIPCYPELETENVKYIIEKINKW